MSYVLVDVDGVILDYAGKMRWGVRNILHGFVEIGYELTLWSGNGEAHAHRTMRRADLPLSSRVFAKPDYPIQLDAALELLGSVPVLQLDDDPTERVADWPFIHIPCDYGTMPGRTPKVAK